MHLRHVVSVSTAALLIAAGGVRPARCDGPDRRLERRSSPTVAQARSTAELGLAFLEKDAAKWRKERQCASCHQGTMTVWALCEAKSQGYAVNDESFAQNTAWAKERLKDIDKPRDTRPGWNMVNTPALYFALMAKAIPTQQAVTPDELTRIAGHLMRHQEENGSWAWSLAPAQNRPPPVFESDDVATLIGCMALEPRGYAGAKQDTETRESRKKATAWLAKTESGNSTQVAALRLLAKVLAGKPPTARRADIDQLKSLQNRDGGWGQLKDLPSDAYATGQALYVLGLAGVKSDREPIQRGVGFLIANQRGDGSWPMTSRAQPGAKPFTNPVPIIYFGSAWATLGLMRTAPK